jgi:hypothetical protein
MNLKNLLFASVIVLSANASFAQDTNVANHSLTISIPEVALLDLEAATTAITLKGSLPVGIDGKAEAGLPMTFGDDATNSTIWMNYSSIVGSTETSRNVTVALSGTVPNGLKLTVRAGIYSGEGKGTLGTAEVEPIVLLSNATAATPIITAIGSAYTGNGINNGHLLTYKLGYATDAATDYAKLRFDTVAPLTITYTLSDI